MLDGPKARTLTPKLSTSTCKFITKPSVPSCMRNLPPPPPLLRSIYSGAHATFGVPIATIPTPKSEKPSLCTARGQVRNNSFLRRASILYVIAAWSSCIKVGAYRAALCAHILANPKTGEGDCSLSRCCPFTRYIHVYRIFTENLQRAIFILKGIVTRSIFCFCPFRYNHN